MARSAMAWPWFAHRSLADVSRTEVLLAKVDARREKMTAAEAGDLGNLLQKARRFNPPPSPKPPGDAA